MEPRVTIPPSLQHPHSLAGTTHFPVTLSRSSGWDSTFNRDSALPGVLPAVGADLESPARRCCLQASQAAAAASELWIWGCSQGGFPADKSSLPGVPGAGLPCRRPRQRWQHVPSQGWAPAGPAQGAGRSRMFSTPSWSLRAPHFSVPQHVQFGASGVMSKLRPILTESGNDQNQKKRKDKLTKN